jgi:hypothetical protein
MEGYTLNTNGNNYDPLDIDQLYRIYQQERILEMPEHFVSRLLARSETELEQANYGRADTLSEERSIEKIMQQVAARSITAASDLRSTTNVEQKPSLLESIGSFMQDLSWLVKAPAAVALTALLSVPLVNVIKQADVTASGAQLAFVPTSNSLSDRAQVPSHLSLDGNTLLSLSGSPSAEKRALTLGALSVDLSVSYSIEAQDKIDSFSRAIKHQAQSLDSTELINAVDALTAAKESEQETGLSELYALLNSEFSQPSMMVFFHSGQLIETLRLESALAITSNNVNSLRAVLANEQARDLLAALATKSDAYPVHVSRLLEIDPDTINNRRTLKQINRSAHSLLVGE